MPDVPPMCFWSERRGKCRHSSHAKQVIGRTDEDVRDGALVRLLREVGLDVGSLLVLVKPGYGRQPLINRACWSETYSTTVTSVLGNSDAKSDLARRQ